jgi:hypothetical protein
VNRVVLKVNVSVVKLCFIMDKRIAFLLNLVTQSASTIIDYEDQLDRQSKDLISTIHKAYKETIEVKI